MTKRRFIVGYAAAVTSAMLVGCFTVVNKWLLAERLPPLAAGAWTYLAAGVALAPWAYRAGRLRIRRKLLLVAWLAAGSLAGPSLYFLGLKLTSGVEGVLMINTESVFTALIAFAWFREPFGIRTALGSAAILAGAAWLSWPSGGERLLSSNTWGNLLIALGYVGWATENNLGRVLATENPTASLVCVKALVAGVVMTALAMVFRQPMVVSWRLVPGILTSGAICLGISLACFYFAMRYIGAGRAGLISSSSVFWGVLLALGFLKESLTLRVGLGGALMLVGLIVFASEGARRTAREEPC